MSWEIIVEDIIAVLFIIGGACAIRMSIAGTKTLKASGAITFNEIVDWYGYFFGVILIIVAVAGICGAFR